MSPPLPMPRITSAVRRSGSVRTWLTSTPRRAEFVAHEAAHLFVADARQHRAARTEPGETGREVTRRAAEVFRERLHVLEAPADLLAVEVHGRAAEADDVEGPVSHG